MTFASNRIVAPRRVALLLGCVVAALGACIFSGWALDIPALKSVFSGAVITKPNAGLAMLLCGAALALVSQEKIAMPARRGSAGLAIATIILAALTVSQDLLGFDLGLDWWLLGGMAGAAESSRSGRMAPAAALGFILVGSALILFSLPRSKGLRLATFTGLGASVAVIGGLALAGQLAGALLGSSWWNFSGLTIYAATAFTLLGCGLLALARSEGKLKWSLGAVTAGGFAIGILSLVATLGISYRLVDQLHRDVVSVGHTQRVITEVEEVESNMAALESGERGYIITGNDGLLERRTTAVVWEHFSLLRRLTAGDPDQQRRLDQLETLIKQRLEWADRTMTVRRQEGTVAAERLVSTGKGFVLTDSVRRVIGEMEDQERALLDQREKQSREVSTRTFLLLPLSVFLSLAFLFLGLFTLNAGAGERALAEAELRTNEARYRGIYEGAAEGISLTTSGGRIVSVNPAFALMLGYASSEECVSAVTDVARQLYADPVAWREIVEELQRAGAVRGHESQYLRKDGTPLWVSLSVRYMRNEHAHLLTMAMDISGRKQAEAHIQRIERARDVISQCNHALARETSEQHLLSEICRIAVERGRYRFAWVGYREHDPAKTVRPVAHLGFEKGYLERAGITWADTPRGRGPTGTAIRTGKVQAVQDIASDPSMVPFREDALRQGYACSVALPLLERGEAFGTLNVYAAEPNVINMDEIELLKELADDLAFGIGAIRERSARERAETALTRMNRVLAVLSGINTLIVRVRDRQTLFNEACRIAVEQGDFGIAWIGTYDAERLEITPAAIAGLPENDYLRTETVVIREDSPQKGGVVGSAVRERRPVYNNDITVDAELGGPRRREAIRRGYRSVIALPLMTDGRVVGNFSVYARELNFFNDEEVRLLTELSGDISFALESIARQEKVEKLSRVRAVSGAVNAAIVRIRERDALLAETCRIASELGKFRMIWIGTTDAAKQDVRPVAWTGFSAEAARAVSWEGMHAAQGTLGAAILTRTRSVRNNIEQWLSGGRLRQEALDQGCRSSVCLPLLVDDDVVAFVVLYAAERGFFDDDELALLDGVAADLSFALQSIAKQDRLDYLAYYDEITGLPNRALFVDRAGQQMRARGGEPPAFAMILVDLERFRYINDTFGQRGGDELLRQVARRLESAFHGKDWLTRFRSDGFGIIMRGVRDAGRVVHAIEGDLIGCFRQSFVISGREVRVSAKVGVAMCPTDGEDGETLFRNAEAAIKRAKATSNHFMFYAAEMNAQAEKSLALETRLRQAVEQQQFVLHYQPKIDLASRKICGLEALIRWQDPASGLVAPGTFIPLLEETGLILEVGKWALRQALEDHRRWTANGIAVPRIAVNVSAVQLQQTDFADVVIDVVQERGDNPEALELEVTESLLMKDVEASIRKLSILRGLGIHVALDDFGTGYSSLSYVARLPINSVKIDRSFINGMAAGPEHMVVVTTIITLAHSLGLQVVAEGVETEEQSRLLGLFKCDQAQGYLFSKPLPFAALEPLLRAPAQAPGSRQPQSVDGVPEESSPILRAQGLLSKPAPAEGPERRT
jgi:diguanylate cyclase (GGDEF)-like protein/PAS domain S-box-containing protein